MLNIPPLPLQTQPYPSLPCSVPEEVSVMVSSSRALVLWLPFYWVQLWGSTIIAGGGRSQGLYFFQLAPCLVTLS